jgi:hypothetical protein
MKVIPTLHEEIINPTGPGNPRNSEGDAEWNSQFNCLRPLVSAISSDNGRTWRDVKLVEADESKSYCYASITFHKSNTILTYYQGVPGGPNLVDMKLKIVPTSAWTD